jgi:hypothetical protein
LFPSPRLMIQKSPFNSAVLGGNGNLLNRKQRQN